MQVELEAAPSPVEPISPPPMVSVWTGRSVRLPACYLDFLPEDSLLGLRYIPQPPPSPSLTSENPDLQPLAALLEFQTEPDSFGLFRIYPSKPTHIPNSGTTLLNVVDAPTLLCKSVQFSNLPNILPPSNITCENLFSAFSSPMAGLLMCWQYSKSNSKTKDKLNCLWTYIKDPSFDSSQQHDFSHDREYKLVTKFLQDDSNPFRAQHGWMRSSVTIPLVKEGKEYDSENDPDVPTMTVDNVFHCSLIDVIKYVFTDKVSASFHFTPFRQYWMTPDGCQVQVYSESYTSPQMVEAYMEVGCLPRKADDQHEHVIIPLMLWLDATHLANFGNVSLWPVYIYFGNQSKYIQGKPTSEACHHCAYIPSVSDDLLSQNVYLLTESHCSYLTTLKIGMSRCTEKHQHVKCILTSSMSLCKLYGSFYLMWSLSRPSKQMYWSSVSITRLGVSSPVCLPTWPTAQKSKSSHLCLSVAS